MQAANKEIVAENEKTLRNDGEGAHEHNVRADEASRQVTIFLTPETEYGTGAFAGAGHKWSWRQAMEKASETRGSLCREEALTKVGTSGGLGSSGSGTVNRSDKDGGNREMELLWNEATTVASSRQVLERPRGQKQTLTNGCRGRDARASSGASVQCRQRFSQRARTDVVLLLVACGGSPPCALVVDRETKRDRKREWLWPCLWPWLAVFLCLTVSCCVGPQ